jgi:hypothetical protein
MVCATIPHALLEPAAATPVRQGPALFDLRIKGSLDAECIGSCIRIKRRT